ncbi:MAG: CDP-alcohol phosphatidyltransferase family protein [Anaerolineales bacterium]
MFDSSLRALKDRLSEPLARRMARLSPQTVTWIALSFGLAAAVSAARGLRGWTLALWLLNRFLDGLDGTLARLHRTQSDFGGYLDILFDFVAYAALPLGLVLAAPTPGNYLALSLMLAAFYVNTAAWMYLAALLEKHAARAAGTQTSIVMPAGLIGGTETVIAYGIFALFPAHIAPLFTVFTVLVCITILQRLAWARKNL